MWDIAHNWGWSPETSGIWGSTNMENENRYESIIWKQGFGEHFPVSAGTQYVGDNSRETQIRKSNFSENSYLLIMYVAFWGYIWSISKSPSNDKSSTSDVHV